MPKISQLESALDITSNDLIQIVDVEDDDMAPSGTNKKTTAGFLANQLAPLINDRGIQGVKINPNFGSVSIVSFGSGGVATNSAIGSLSLSSNTTGLNNTANGVECLFSNTTGDGNTAIGIRCLYFNTDGDGNSAQGLRALHSNTTGNNNSAFGVRSIYSNTTGLGNVGSGAESLYHNSTGSNNVAVGNRSLHANTTASNNTACGNESLSLNQTFENISGLGFNSQVTGSNQIQLGNSSTTTYAYGTVQNRSDARDKADIRDTQLGLDFISSLRPVDYKWDMREDYRPERPETPPVDATAEELEKYEARRSEWLENIKLSNITHNGSKKRNRYHHGLIAQEVKAVIEETGVDFGGFQDHSINGGDDVFSIGYFELIAPLIKAVQELKARVEQLESA